MLSGYFILYALAGYLSAGEYSDILEEYTENLNNDDEIDEIMDAMDYHEKDRMGFVNALCNLASILSRSSDGEISDTIVHFETSILDLRKVIDSYIKILCKQRMILLRCFDRVQSYFTRSSTLEQLSLYFEFQTLMEQYRYQIESEENLVHKITVLIENGDMYTHFGNGGQSPVLNIVKERDVLSERKALHDDQWIQFKVNFLSFIQKKYVYTTNIHDAEVTLDFDILHQKEKEAFDNYTSRKQTSERPLKYQSLYGMLNVFLGMDVYGADEMNMHLTKYIIRTGSPFVLLTGACNSGKSFFCQDLQNRVSNHDDLQHVHVIRPKIPGDFLAPLVGSMEDAIFSLFAYLDQTEAPHKKILLLDDIHHLLGEPMSASSNDRDINPRRDHLVSRVRAAWTSCIDRLKIKDACDGLPWRYLVICTSQICDDDFSDRYDYSFQLLEPESEERKHIISTSLCTSECSIDQQKILMELVDATMGKSRGEITMYCREVMREESDGATSHIENTNRLEALKRLIRSILPESIKNSAMEGFADLKVWSAKELRSSLLFDDNGVEILPLIGNNAKETWNEIENLIITPLCRSNILHSILYGNSVTPGNQANKSISAGVLIHGDPGVGKTTIAYHCAAVASGINPNIRLIEVPCTSLIHKELGGSERSVQKLFATARAASPCILLLDGIENIGQVRGHDTTTEGTMDRLLSTLLIEMDGVSSNMDEEDTKHNIAIIGVTHNPPSWIDPALLRPGRLEKCLRLEKPDVSTRRSIFSSAIADLNIDFTDTGYFDPKDKNDLMERISMMSHSKSAADIIAIVENAKMLALRDIISCKSVDECDVSEQISTMSISYKYFLT